ncbi:hypothetical protein FZC76_19405 [Sutcliffiella horikoshii]|uniref:Uncharacterized protein n=1 Tax=Sutcliffiella horikoshii TaxID=79883 RepID=A0A5D4SPC4_9BACI|nr:hypothetical protein FZC76_19405 [Sutcliffiella horikoshii]
MKTSLTRKQEERSPHHRYEDLIDEKTRGEKSSSPVKGLTLIPGVTAFVLNVSLLTEISSSELIHSVV